MRCLAPALALAVWGVGTAGTVESGPAVERSAFGPGERVAFRISYAHLLAGRATLAVLGPEREGGAELRYLAEARSQGFFASLLRFHVDDRTVATWDADRGCSLRIEKRLREGRATRDQEVEFEPAAGTAHVRDPKILQTTFEAGTCALDVLSALSPPDRPGPEPGHPSPACDIGASATELSFSTAC